MASLPPSSPTLQNAFDAIALAAHAGMLAVGFRLVGLGEDHRIEASSDPSHPQPLPTQWNANTGSSYSFRYRHSQSSMEYLLKVNRMGSTAVVMGMGMGDDRTCSFDAKVADYISEGNLPATLPTEERLRSEAQRKITDIFISVGRLSDLGSLLRLNILQKLVPKIHKEGYEETVSSQSNSNTDPAPRGAPDRPARDPLRDDRGRDPYQPARPHPLHDPLAMPPRRPMPEPMPGFEDEHELQQPPFGGMPGGFPRIGDRDLYPQGMGPNDPFRGGVGPGFGGGGMGGGGMHPSFDDPLFRGQGQGRRPPGPPGSRYDNPGPGMGHPRGAGLGGRPPNPFGGFGSGDFI